MDFLVLAKSRYSVRRFKDIPIAEEVLDNILEAGRVAPTAHNDQPQRIYVLKSEDALAKIKKCSPHIFGAPLVLLVCYDTAVSMKKVKDHCHDTGQQDASIAATHMMLEAWTHGVGSCWVNTFVAEGAAKAFHLPETVKPLLVMPMGYPADDSKPFHLHEASVPLSDLVKVL